MSVDSSSSSSAASTRCRRVLSNVLKSRVFSIAFTRPTHEFAAVTATGGLHVAAVAAVATAVLPSVAYCMSSWLCFFTVCSKVVLLSAEDLELDVKENGVLGNNGKDTMSSVVRIQKYGWLDAPMTRSRTSGPVAAEPLYKYRYPNARFGEARGFDHITIR